MGIIDKVKGLVDKRGGTDAAKEDAQELRDVAQGEGSNTEKAKDAAEALKEPGAADGGGAPAEGERPS